MFLVVFNRWFFGVASDVLLGTIISFLLCTDASLRLFSIRSSHHRPRSGLQPAQHRNFARQHPRLAKALGPCLHALHDRDLALMPPWQSIVPHPSMDFVQAAAVSTVWPRVCGSSPVKMPSEAAKSMRDGRRCKGCQYGGLRSSQNRRASAPLHDVAGPVPGVRSTGSNVLKKARDTPVTHCLQVPSQHALIAARL